MVPKKLLVLLFGCLMFTVSLMMPAFGQRTQSRRSSTETGSASAHSGHVSVRSYTRRNGTYVAPHHRSQPNHTQRDNWSAKGNVNPDTGKRGHKIPKH